MRIRDDIVFPIPRKYVPGIEVYAWLNNNERWHVNLRSLWGETECVKMIVSTVYKNNLQLYIEGCENRKIYVPRSRVRLQP